MPQDSERGVARTEHVAQHDLGELIKVQRAVVVGVHKVELLDEALVLVLIAREANSLAQLHEIDRPGAIKVQVVEHLLCTHTRVSAAPALEQTTPRTLRRLRRFASMPDSALRATL